MADSYCSLTPPSMPLPLLPLQALARIQSQVSCVKPPSAIPRAVSVHWLSQHKVEHTHTQREGGEGGAETSGYDGSCSGGKLMKSTDWKIFVAFEGGQRLPLTSDFDKLMHVVSSEITINIRVF